MSSPLSKLMADGNYHFPTNDGHFISEKQRRINEIIQEYDPNLELQWIPAGQRSTDDVAFRVVARPPGRAPYLVLTAEEADERLLARLFVADQQNATGGRNVLSYLDNYNNAIEIYRAKTREEARVEDHDLAASIIRSNKSSYVHNGVDFERARRR